MNKRSLEDKRARLEQRFQELSDQRGALEQEIYRLQGEHRAYLGLLAEFEDETVSAKPKREKVS